MSAQRPAGVGLDVGRLVQLDLAFLGPRVIVVEYTLGVAGSLLLGLMSFAYAARYGLPVWSWPVLIGIELCAIAVNYVPMLVEALRRYRDGTAIAATRAALREDGREARSFGIRQAWIVVPGAVLLFALLQSADRASTRV